ncbi:hypothetical protein EI94DRAFT_504960 [Lactarius quietus]|nr:hypothetical protein EI94DRAFT_504960 [Lactarius quietus]
MPTHATPLRLCSEIPRPRCHQYQHTRHLPFSLWLHPMPFWKHDPRHRAQTNGVHPSISSASLSSFSSSDSSILPAAPPSKQSDLPNPDQSVHTSPTTAHRSHLPPNTILPVPRSSSLIPAMGQIPSLSQFQHSVPPPSPTKPVGPGSAGSRLKHVFSGRRKKSEDLLPNTAPALAPVPVAIEKSRSVMMPASSMTSSPPAPKHQQKFLRAPAITHCRLSTMSHPSTHLFRPQLALHRQIPP